MTAREKLEALQAFRGDDCEEEEALSQNYNLWDGEQWVSVNRRVTNLLCGNRPGDAFYLYNDDPVRYFLGIMNREPPDVHFVPESVSRRDRGASRIVIAAMDVHLVFNHCTVYEAFYWSRYLLFDFLEEKWFGEISRCPTCTTALTTGGRPKPICDVCYDVCEHVFPCRRCGMVLYCSTECSDMGQGQHRAFCTYVDDHP